MREFFVTLRAMIFPLARNFLVAIACCAVAACNAPLLPKWAKRKPVPKAVPLKFPKPTSDGTKGTPRQAGAILFVNADGGFVLIDSHGWSPPTEGTALKVMRDGKEAGVVTVSSERQGSHVIADIITGTPRKGDQVFQ
jgi:hypothetical protein